MQNVSQDEYEWIASWLEKARNYIKISPPGEDYIMHGIRNDDGNIIVVAEKELDYTGKIVYRMRETVYKVWRSKSGYTITL